MFTVLGILVLKPRRRRIVSGMSHTLNLPGDVSPTVRLHPSGPRNPCAWMYLLLLRRVELEHHPAIVLGVLLLAMVAFACTYCGFDACPPISSPTLAERL